jgi:ankyrin repeat protein
MLGDGLGSTPLHWASRGHDSKDGFILRLLLEHGADINGQDRSGWTTLHWVSIKGALEVVVRLLLEHGAGVEVKDNSGRTALEFAATRGHDKIVKLLQEHGAR